MGKGLAKTFVYVVIAFVFGLLLMWAAGQAGTNGESAQEMQTQQWRMSLYGTGLLFMTVAIIADAVLQMVFEYKILGK